MRAPNFETLLGNFEVEKRNFELKLRNSKLKLKKIFSNLPWHLYFRICFIFQIWCYYLVCKANHKVCWKKVSRKIWKILWSSGMEFRSFFSKFNSQLRSFRSKFRSLGTLELFLLQVTSKFLSSQKPFTASKQVLASSQNNFLSAHENGNFMNLGLTGLTPNKMLWSLHDFRTCQYFTEHLPSSSLQSSFSAVSSSLYKDCNHPIVGPFWKT